MPSHVSITIHTSVHQPRTIRKQPTHIIRHKGVLIIIAIGAGQLNVYSHGRGHATTSASAYANKLLFAFMLIRPFVCTQHSMMMHGLPGVRFLGAVAHAQPLRAPSPCACHNLLYSSTRRGQPQVYALLVWIVRRQCLHKWLADRRLFEVAPP